MLPSFFIRYKTLIVSSAIGLFILLSFLTIFLPHHENDEVIYQTLGIKLSHLQSYNLQGSEILKILPQKIYNTQVFFRPPAFMLYLAFLYRILGVVGLYLAPVIIYILLCIVIYKTVFLLTKSQHIALKSLLLSATSTLLIFLSTKIHLDLFLGLMISISLFFLIHYKEKQQMASIFLSGLFFVFAVLTKYTALLFCPFFSVFLIIVSTKKRLLNLSLFFLPALLLVLWFYYLFFVAHVRLDALFSIPDQEMLTNFPFVRYVYNRPFYFYFLNIFLTNPLYLLFFIVLKKGVWHDLRNQYGFLLYFLISIVLAVFIALTLYGARGGTYQMRYILSAEPFLIILLSLITFEKYKSVHYLFYVFVINNLFLVLYNLGNAELLSFFEMMKNR